MITVWNPTEKPIQEHVGGQLIIVPPLGNAQVTEKKAPELLRLQPALRASQNASYTPEDFAAMKALPKEKLQELAAMLMRGVMPKVADYAKPAGGQEPK